MISRDVTVTIFDWDDTVLPTSWLEGFQVRKLGWPAAQTGVVANLLPPIEDVARLLLATAIQQGRTFIVTNASSGWVEETAAKYLPGFAPLLKQVTIVSARSAFEARYPEQARRWKVQAFLEIARECDFRSIRDVIVVGDGECEMNAANVLSSLFANLQVKAVKLQQRPSASDLVKQLQLVQSNFKEVVSRERSLYIALERRLKRT